MGKAHIEIPKEKIVEFCQKWKIREFAFFGSVLRRDFRPDSDIDVLVTFDESARHTLFDLVHMEEELKEIFGREVDVVSRRFEIIGEASRRISEETRISHSELPWGEMIAMRNVMIHEYDDVDLVIVWETVKNNLPSLIES